MAIAIMNAAGAAALAAAATVGVSAVLALAGRRPRWQDMPALGITLFFVALTQYPFPDPAGLTCPVPLATPAFVPGNSIFHLARQVETWGWKVAFFQDSTFFAAVMNYLICVAIGLALAWQGRFSDRAILAFAAALPVLVELTQITGVWGLYPCAYRKFDADDIVLNFAGVATGLWWGRRRWPTRRPG